MAPDPAVPLAGAIGWLVLACLDGTHSANRFGQDSKVEV